MLLVEDETRIRRLLQIALRDEGYRILEAADGGSALAVVADNDVDVVVLDLMLPDMDGFEVCRQLRKQSDVPIIVASARADSHDIVAGLAAGADDYVVKPVVAKELSARIRALLRRSRQSASKSEAVTSGALQINPRQGLVTLNGEEIPLTTTEFRLLEQLAERAGEVVSRETLLERVWGNDFLDDTRLLDVHVSRLRSKIEENPTRPQHVVTVRGLGYKLSP
ncbi:MAG TPA: response regulator transcription factor [Gemmatimonadales bacterium]|nr:response regulator transcription factor [Gemmatimonadales bacterium]